MKTSQLITTASGALLLAATTLLHPAAAQPASPPPGPKPGPNWEACQQHRAQKEERLRQYLGLTDEQAAELRSLRQAHRQAKQAIKNDSTLTPEQRRERLRALREQHRKDRDEILTPEQQQKLRAWREIKKQRGPATQQPGQPPAPAPGV